MTADQILQESIIDLQKQNLCAETRHVVDEAAQLLADGREIEARALVEKAQAICVADVHSKTNGVTKAGAPPAEERPEPTVIAHISDRLAQGITKTLNEAIADLAVHFGARMNGVVKSVEDRLTEIASQLTATSDLHERVEHIEQEETARANAVQQRLDRLSLSITSLQETDHVRRVEVEQLSRSVSGELETISTRVRGQEERIEALSRLVQDLSPAVASVVEQIDRHDDLIRSMHQRQAHRVAALNEALDAIAKLREPKTLVQDVGAG